MDKFNTKLDNMLDKIEEKYETHCISFCWDLYLPENLDNVYELSVTYDYPLCNVRSIFFVSFHKNLNIIDELYSLITNSIDKTIRKAAKKYGY